MRPDQERSPVEQDGPADVQRPNVVLIVADQWRGDCLGVDGHPAVDTPILNRLAHRGTRFTRAYSATPTCVPARAALYTGQSQNAHGRVGYQDGVPWDYPVTLAGEFTRHGYQTEAVGKLHVYPERSQMGFQHVQLHDGYLHHARDGRGPSYDEVDDYMPWLRRELGRDDDYAAHGVHCNSHVARPWDKPEYTHPTNWVTEQSVRFLRRRDPGKPFFLYMSYHRPHPPYDPPAWAFEQYLERELPAPAVGDWAEDIPGFAALLPGETRPGDPEARWGELPPHVQRRAQAGYYGLMTHIDHQIGYFTHMLAEHGLAKNTVICFTSDHGEMMGDHHMFRKGYPYEGSTRVPLVLAGPGVPSDTTVDGQVAELRDVMPTLLEVAGLPVPGTVEGHSLLGPARGESDGWRAYLHGEHTVSGHTQQWITDSRYKYCWFSGTGHEQLFDLDEDPGETVDLAADPGHAEELERLRGLLVDELSWREEGFVGADGQLVAGRPVDGLLRHPRTPQPTA